MSRNNRSIGRWLLGSLCSGLLLTAQGCNVVGFAGAMIESQRRHSNKTVKEDYRGLAGKKWAVIVQADRIIQADYPAIVAYLTIKMTDRFADKVQQEKIGAAGYIPADTLLRYLYENPRWTTMARGELAKELGVDRLIIVELLEYRLNDPGNQYVWNGLATGSVGVTEADGPVPDEFAFQKPISVAFPDKEGFTPTDLQQQVVATELARRFVDRATWPFYSHEEPYYPKY